MHIFQSEFAHDYTTYVFGYQVHAELESGEEAHTAYERGFLPRSNEPERHNLLYLARSVRVPLTAFEPTSENRRVLKKFDETLTCVSMTREELVRDQTFHAMFLTYFSTRHGAGVMSRKRLEGILETTLPLRGVRYDDKGTAVAYALEISGATYLHSWYPVYDIERIGMSFGMWMMLDAVRRAKSEGKEYVYLGTAYGDKGKYKMNLEPLEFWDGETWQTDMHLLKTLLKSEKERVFVRP